MFLAGFFGFFAVWNVVFRFFFRTVNQRTTLSFLFIFFGRLGLSFGLRGCFWEFYEIVFDWFNFAGSDTVRHAGSGLIRSLQFAFSRQLDFDQVIKCSRVIVPVVDYVSPRLHRVHVIPLHQPDDLLIRLDLVLSHNDALRFVSVTRSYVPLALPNLVYFETRLRIYVQNVSQNVLCVD